MVEKSERQEQNQDLRCQSGPSAKDSVIISGGDSSKNYGADQQRLQISDLHFDKFPTPHVSHCGISASDYHFNHGFIVLKDIQRRTGTRMCSA